jgi:endonuclease VIII
MGRPAPGALALLCDLEGVPEGDTIHYAANRIRAVLEGQVPEEIVTPHPRHGAERWPQRLDGRAVRAVDAHGKHLFMRFEGDLTLHSHLRMTGAWGVHREGARWKRARRRAWLIVRHAGWEVVEFDGPVLELMADARTRSDPRLASLGQDVLGESFAFEPFLRRLRADDQTRPIGDALLDQRTVAGIGNLWKAEACFAVAIDPWRRLADVSDEEAVALVEFAREHMRRSAREGFSARPRAVYNHAGRPCPRCGTPIRSAGQWENNRLTFWCPGCQR